LVHELQVEPTGSGNHDGGPRHPVRVNENETHGVKV
jgi:hypothetical protein